MNKKLFFGMFAAASMLLATSCSNDELEAVQSGNEAQVTFSLGLEGGIGSRAISDGKTADKLVYAVYNETGTPLAVFGQEGVYQQTEEIGDITTTPHTVKITLAKGQTYQVAFWAQNEACTAYNTADLKNVTVSYKAANGTDNATNNDEVRDAFFKAVKFEVVGNKTIDVVLKRPFAQINVGVEESDWNAAVASGVEIEKSKVVIKNAANSINLLTGAVSGDTEVTYDFNAIPTDILEVETDKTKEGKEKYKWLSMSYILVKETSTTDEDKDETLGDAPTTLNSLQFTFDPKSGNNIEFKEGLNGAPVQRNWRTNILGKILTGDIQFKISIDPIYDGDYIYPDGTIEQELAMAATFGGTVTLTKELNLTSPLNVTADMVLNLNGYTITGNFSDKALINNTGTLKLMGTDTIKNTAENGAAVITNSGKLVLDDVTIEGAPIGTTGYPSYAVSTSGELTVEEGTTISSDRGAIYMNNGANVTINGGNIKVTDALGSRVLTAHVIYAYGSNSKLTINDGNFEMAYAAAGNTGASVICPAGATIDVYGGNFSYAGTVGQSGIFQNYMGYSAPVKVYGGTYADSTVEKNVASGYHAIQSNGIYYVVPKDVSAVATTADELAAALIADKENIKVVLADNIDLPISSLGNQTGGSGEYKLGGKNTKNIAIDLNDKKLNITTTYWSNLGAKNADALFTIKNGTMTSSQATGTWNSYDLTFSNCDYVIEDVTFEKAIAFANAGKSAILKNVTINETHDYYAMWITAEGQNVTIDGLTINSDGRGIKIDEQYVDTPTKVTLNINNATFKTVKKAAIMVKSTAGTTINASNLNISEVAADNYHAVWVDADAAAYADKVAVNGAYKAVEGTVAKVTNSSELAKATIKNNSVILLGAGDYVVPDAAKEKNVTFIGTGNPEDIKVAVTKIGTGGENCDYGLDGSTVTFDGITITTNSSTYIGYARCNGTYKNCIINGTYTLYGNSTFENCTFNVTGDVYNIWTWGAPTATFTDCTFNSDGKAILLYGTTNTELTINNCTFNDNGGLTDLKAAIEIGNDYNKSYNLIVNNTTVNGYEINDKGINTNTTLWANKNSMDQDKLNVVVDGVDVY